MRWPVTRPDGISGRALRQIRERFGWYQRELAEELRVARQTISLWENNGVPEDEVDRVLGVLHRKGILGDWFLELLEDYSLVSDPPAFD